MKEIPPILSFSIVPSKAKYSLGERIELKYELRNHHKSDCYILRWYTPLEGIRSNNFLSVFHEGLAIQYEGMFVKRIKPSEDNFILVKSGESKTGAIDLSSAFYIDKEGEYNIDVKIVFVFYPTDISLTRKPDNFCFVDTLNFTIESGKKPYETLSMLLKSKT